MKYYLDIHETLLASKYYGYERVLKPVVSKFASSKLYVMDRIMKYHAIYYPPQESSKDTQCEMF